MPLVQGRSAAAGPFVVLAATAPSPDSYDLVSSVYLCGPYLAAP